MNQKDFLTLVESLNGLTQPMVDALRALAPKLTDEQRAKAAEDLQHASDDILSALQTMQEHDEEAAQELHRLTRAVTKEEEGEERESDIAASAALLQDA